MDTTDLCFIAQKSGTFGFQAMLGQQDDAHATAAQPPRAPSPEPQQLRNFDPDQPVR
ncbi:MAG: hypothetical protein AAFV53_35735 [Myxococcota bacterium]